jgi:hypothetical protein
MHRGRHFFLSYLTSNLLSSSSQLPTPENKIDEKLGIPMSVGLSQDKLEYVFSIIYIYAGLSKNLGPPSTIKLLSSEARYETA